MLEVEGVKIENSALVYEPAEDTFLAMNAIKKAAEGLKAPASIIKIGVIALFKVLLLLLL